MATHDKNATRSPPPPRRRAGSAARDIAPSAAAERLLRTGEVARLLRLSRTAVYYMIRRGDLPSISVRRMLRVRAGDLNDYLRLHARRAQRPRSKRKGISP